MTKRCVLAAAAAWAIELSVFSPARADSRDYLDVVRAYADAMIEHGRDAYGPAESPLFAAALDRGTLRLLEGESLERVERIARSQWGVRPNDRTLTGANPMHDENLYQVLYALAQLTGERKYAEEADAALRWFLEHCQSPATGLMAWGEHMGWDFRTEGPIRDVHEFARPWVLWDRCYELAPEACRRFASGVRQHQIADLETGRFSRHAAFSKHGPGRGYEFPRHGGFYIATWASAYERTGDAELLKAIEALTESFDERRNPASGAIPAETATPELCWPPSNLSLAIDLEDSAAKVPNDLGAKMRACAARTDAVFLEIAHEIEPGGRGFLSTMTTSTLEPGRARGGGSGFFTETWSTGYGQWTDAQVAMFCLLRWEQVKAEEYEKLFLAAADRYLASEPDASRVVWPGAMGDAITLLVEVHRITGDRRYLDRGDRLGRIAVELFFPDDSPLPKASSQHDHYEAITRADTLAMALVSLWAAKHKPGLDLGMVWPER